MNGNQPSGDKSARSGDLDRLKLKYSNLASLYSNQTEHGTDRQTTFKLVNPDSLKFIHPPGQLLPPLPPPVSSFDAKNSSDRCVSLPSIKKQAIKTVTSHPNRHSRKQNLKSQTEKLPKVDRSTSPNHGTTSEFMCRLCGVKCMTGDILYAHLLVLQHVFELPSNSHHKDGKKPQPLQTKQLLICRRCGTSWSEFESWSQVNQHGCVRRNAAFLNMYLTPKRSLIYGPPLVCLFCCAKPQLCRKRLPYVRKPRQRKGFWHAHQTCVRFKSKLHLALHIVCRHSMRRQVGTCGECGQVVPWNGDPKDSTDVDFWFGQSKYKPIPKPRNAYSSSSESEQEERCASRASTDSVLWRQDLQPLDHHLDSVHLPAWDVLYWLKLPYLIMDRMSKPSMESWIYHCPICQLSGSTNQSDTSGQTHKKYLTSNAMLQAHIACYHAGARQLDTLMGLCQICETNRKPDSKSIGPVNWSQDRQIRHLIRAGHVERLEKNHDEAVRQGRLSLGLGNDADWDWGTTCLFCWRRFLLNPGDRFEILLAQCRLQAHLVAYHCSASWGQADDQVDREDELERFCGWCNNSTVPKGAEPRLRKMTLDELYISFQQHEEAHAWGLAVWWNDNAPTKVERETLE